MDINWENFKYTFIDEINKANIYDFEGFFEMLKNLNTNESKGIYFEYFCKLYFCIETLCKNTYKNFYMYNEIPSELKKKINLPQKDKGIDCIAIDKYDKIYAIQVKFRKKITRTIPFNEIATFQALTFGTGVKIDFGIFFTSCIDVCEELRNDKYNNILHNTLRNKCDALFWKNVREYIGNKIITHYIIKKPLNHQEKIIKEVENYYKKYDNGRLYLACGTGKTFIAYWISVKVLNYNKIFIVVPSLYLLSQTFETWFKETQYETDKYNFILIGSDIDNKDILCEYMLTTDKNTIEKELIKKEKTIVITTYHSSELLIEICNKLKYKFDFGIYDEAHRTVGEEEKCFTSLLTSNIEKKKLLMTATEKVFSYTNKLKSEINMEKILSMDNEKIYGKVIYKYSMRQAIDDKVLVDYNLIAPFIDPNKLNENQINKFCLNEEKTAYDIKIILTGLMIISVIKQKKNKTFINFFKYK